MKLILKQNIKSIDKIKDFELNPLSNSFISVGTKMNFYSTDKNNNYKENKSISKKIYSSEKIQYIKEENQLFASSTFYIKNTNNEVYKCDSSKKKVIECVFKNDKNVENLVISPSGKIIYTADSYLYSYDIASKKEIKTKLSDDHENNYSIFLCNEHIILKNRKTHENCNTIQIFSSNLQEINTINSKDNNIFIKLIGVHLFTTKLDGYLEIWDAITSKIYDYRKISDSKITYITNDDEWFYFGNSSGQIIMTTDKFDIIAKIQIFKSEIKKIIYSEDLLYVLSENGEIAILLIIDDDNTSVISKFIKKYKIHPDYIDFFTTEKVSLIENFIKKLNMNECKYTPCESLIFKALETGIYDKKVCILGKDPYFQANVATGLAFEVKKKSWGEKSINSSLKNMLKLIYYSYTNELKEISEIRNEIDTGKFKILAPDKLFKSWENQGVLLLNTALTTLQNQAGAHHKFWDNIIKSLIEYISLKNPNITYLLWGKDAQVFEKYIISGNKISHNHPAIAGNLDNPNDFINGKSFIDTMDIINWLGVDK